MSQLLLSPSTNALLPPLWQDFTFETCTGEILVDTERYTVIFVRNHHMGNGSFKRLMLYLEDRDVLVKYVRNKLLAAMLVKHGYEKVGYSNYLKLKK